MKKKYKLKKSAIIIICLIIISLIALTSLIISLFKTNSYSIEYNLDNYAISENYDIKEKLYYYEITYKEKDYNFIYGAKRTKSQKLITDIETIEEDNFTCLIINSEYIKTNPLCSEDNAQIDIHLISSSIKEKISNYIDNREINEEKYQNYTIYNRDNNILIWSYKGFNYIKDNEINFIKLFNKDIYEIPHATKINNYIIMPNYEQDYDFDEMYIINLDNLEVDTWKLDYKISFDSYVTGINDKSVYIIDNKSKREYELVPHMKKMRILANNKKQGIIYKNGQEEKISMNKLTTSIIKFTYKNNYRYSLEDNTLYLSYLDNNHKIKVSNQIVTSIIYINNDDIYYLVENTLYNYNLKYGETKLISYSEWEFNNQNLIFINS